MDGLEILESLRGLGVSVRAVGLDRLRLEPASKIPAEMVPRIREAKPAILEALRKRPTTCAGSCYEIEPGRWIHRPWNGCTTVKTEASRHKRQVATTCWHCGGTKKCDCSTCSRGWAHGPGECAACEGRGQLWQWVQ